MGAIRFPLFLGEAPLKDPTQLEVGQAEVSTNNWVVNGSLQPLKGPGQGVPSKLSGTALTIWLYRPYNTSPGSGYWFEFPTQVDVLRSPIANDPHDRAYYLESGTMRFTTAAIATAGTGVWPAAAYALGLLPPSPPTLSVSGTGTGTAESRAYVVSIVDYYGSEGPLSLPSAIVSVQAGQTVTVTLPGFPAGSFNYSSGGQTGMKLYRAATGESGTAYLHVATIPLASVGAPYADTIPTAQLGSEALSATWTGPPAGLKGLIMLPGGVLAAFKGNAVYFSEPGQPHAWPIEYMRTVDFEIVGLAVFGNSVLVLTTGQPYLMQGIDPISMSVSRYEDAYPCVAKQSIVDFGDFVVFASYRGLVRATPNRMDLITATLFTYQQWVALLPATIKAYEWEGRYVMFYNDGTDKSMVIDPMEPDTGVIRSTVTARCGYFDRYFGALFLHTDGQIQVWNTGSNLSNTYRSRKERTAKPSRIGCVQVIANNYPLTAQYYADGAFVATATVNSATPVRLTSGVRGRYHQLELLNANGVVSATLASSPREVGNI